MDHIADTKGMSVAEKISHLSGPLFLLGSFALTIPYQLYQIKVVLKNMQAYKVGDPKRIKDPKTIIMRRGLSALGGVLGTIGCVLGTGIFYAVGGCLKVATGVMCLYTNTRLYFEGCREEGRLLKKRHPERRALETARYKKLKGIAGFISSGTYIGYFVLTLLAGMCPPVATLGLLSFGLSLICAGLEAESSQEKYYNTKKIIDKVGWKNWARGNYDAAKYKTHYKADDFKAKRKASGDPPDVAAKAIAKKIGRKKPSPLFHAKKSLV